MKKLLAVILTLTMLFALCSCGNTDKSKDESQSKGDTVVAEEMNVYVLSGPTGIGAVNLWAKSDSGNTQNKYHFSCVSANDEIVAAVSKGDADIAAVATNMAAALYNKTDGNVEVIAVNTLSVLSMLAKNDEIKSLDDLKGKDIYAPGQGANPEYILRYILSGNGIDPDKDVNIHFVAEGSELMSVWASDPSDVILAPQPVATSLLVNNKDDAKVIFDMFDEWNKIADDSKLRMGGAIVRKDYLKEHHDAVKLFLEEYKESVMTAVNDPESTGTLCESYGIIPKAAIATKAIPSCGLTFVTGAEMKNDLSGYLSVMFNANPKSVGGSLPADDFYYVAE